MGDLKEISAMKAEMVDRFGFPSRRDGKPAAQNHASGICRSAPASSAWTFSDSSCAWRSARPTSVVRWELFEMITAGKNPYRFTPDHLFKAGQKHPPGHFGAGEKHLDRNSATC
jgi:hypothetical protein